MNPWKRIMTGVLLTLCVFFLSPAAISHAISFTVGAPIEAQPLSTTSAEEPAATPTAEPSTTESPATEPPATESPTTEPPMTEPPAADVTLLWDSPTMTYNWRKDETDRYVMYPSEVCVPVTLTSSTLCADLDITVICDPPPQSDQIIFFGGENRAVIGISATPDGPVTAQLTFTALPGACAQAGLAQSSLVFYYRIVPDAGVSLSSESIGSVQNSTLQSGLSCAIAAMTPHHHQEAGNQ